MIDLHVHTRLCRHAEGDASEYLAVARGKGIDTMAFCGHLPLLDSDDTEYAMARHELPRYVDEIRGLPNDDVEVLLGIEADWVPGREDETAALLAGHDFDIVLGSVHFVDGWAFDDPAYRDDYASWDIRELWERYFDLVAEAASSGLFDVMAHPDLVKKFGDRPDVEPLDLYAKLAEALSEANVAIEVSTAGLRKPAGEIYPAPSLLAEFHRAGVLVTVGSDAHSPREVGYAWDEAVGLIRSVGYESIVIFRHRQPTEVAL